MGCKCCDLTLLMLFCYSGGLVSDLNPFEWVENV